MTMESANLPVVLSNRLPVVYERESYYECEQLNLK